LERLEIPSTVERIIGFNSLMWSCDNFDIEDRQRGSIFSGLSTMIFA
jgi:hypothetical protein